MRKPVLLFISAGVLLILFCISLKSSITATSNGIRTEAVCTRVEKPKKRLSRKRGWRFTSYRFRHTGPDEEPLFATIEYGAFWLKPKVGDSVRIIYVEGSPSLTYYDSVYHVWMFPAFFGGLLFAMTIKRLIKRRPAAQSEHSL